MTETSRRGYIWASLVMVVLLVAVLLWPSSTHDPDAEDRDPILSAESLDTASIYTNHEYHHGKKVYRSKHLTQEGEWRKIYEGGTPYQDKYADFKLELNSADTTDLKELHGIGSSFARRIVKYRDLLGGYQGKEQLKEVYGMTDTLYSMIASHIVVDTFQVKKVDLNSVSLDQLKRHPYLDYYQAKAIIRHREKNGNYSSIEELLDISLIDTDTYNRLKNYLTI